MKYQELVDVYSALEATTKRLEKTEIIAEYLKKLDSETIEQVGLLILGVVFPAWSSEEIGIGGKLVERAVAEAVGTTQSAVEDAVRDEGDIGLACIKLYAKKSQMTFFSKPLTIDFVFNSLRKLSKISGSRSTNRKIAVILELLSQASATEAKYLTRTITEELRIGVGDGVVRDAIAQAFDIDKKVVERAQMLTNDFSVVARTAKEEGSEGLEKLNLTPGTPVKPMLAQLAPPWMKFYLNSVQQYVTPNMTEFVSRPTGTVMKSKYLHADLKTLPMHFQKSLNFSTNTSHMTTTL